MRHRILTAVGVLAAITGLASSVHAQQTVGSNSRTGEFTLSGDSLVGISNRSVDDDFNRFFLGNSSTPAPINSSTPIVNTDEDNNNLTAQQPQQTDIWQLSENVQVVTSDSLSSPIRRIPGRQNEPLSNVERVQVQIGDY